MIIGHLPSGYILFRTLAGHRVLAGLNPLHIMLAAVCGAVAPDLDMFYFYMIDNRQTHHHSYWSHFPIVWFGLMLLALFWHRMAQDKDRARLGILFACAGFMHLLLDSIVGDVWWLAPFVDQPYVLFVVPALYQPWWLNFILHWSFLLELFLWGWAFWLWRRS